MEYEIDTWEWADPDRMLEGAEVTLERKPASAQRTRARSEEETAQHAILIPEEETAQHPTLIPDEQAEFA